MKTIRTILATFGVTTLLYGLFALIAMRLDLTFTGRSIYQLFRSTGFAALVLGVGCILSFVIMTIALVSFREDGKTKKRDFFEDEDDEEFIEEETVPAERADEADEAWSPEIKRKQRKALFATDEQTEPEIPDLFGEDDEDESPIIPIREPEQTPEPEPAAAPQSEPESEPQSEPEAAEEPDSEPESEPAPEDTTGKKKCAHCGEWIDADSAFCNRCGRRA